MINHGYFWISVDFECLDIVLLTCLFYVNKTELVIFSIHICFVYIVYIETVPML